MLEHLKGREPKRLFGMFFLLFGAALLLVGLIQAAGTALYIRRAEPATGTVVSYDQVHNAAPLMDAVSGTGILYYPVVEFRTLENQSVQFTAPRGRGEKTYEIGARVSVLYNPNQPSRSRLDTFWGLWGPTAIFGGLGLLFGVIGFLAPFGFGGSRRNGGV